MGRKGRRVQTRPAGTSGKDLTERHHKPPHASEPEPKPQKPSNQLNNFQLQRFTKKPSAFRYTGKQQHLNSAKTQIQAPNTLITSVLQEFQQQYPRFRCSVGMKHRRVQTRPAGTSGKDLTERHHKPPHAEIRQELHGVQMHRKTTVSELREMRIQALNMLTASALQEFQQQYPRFRCSVGVKQP